MLTGTYPAFSEESTPPSVSKAHELVTSYNPDNSCTMEISDGTLTVAGKYTSDTVERIFLTTDSSTDATLSVSDNGEFTAKLPLDSIPTLFDESYIIIALSSGAQMRYRVQYDEGWYFPDNGIKEQNASVPQNAYETVSAAWASYVSDELDRQTVADTLEQIQALSDEITDGMTDDYQKMMALARWTSENIYYDEDARDNSVTISTICLKNVLRDHRTVCGGFANLYCALLEAQGIKAVNIKGSVASGGYTYEGLHDSPQNHEWAAVWLDGRWIYMDVVWNTGNFYANGEYHQGKVDDQYSDITPFALSFDHRADRAEVRHYFRALEYFDADSKEEFSYEGLEGVGSVTVRDTQTELIFRTVISVLIMAAVITVGALILNRIRKRGK